MVVCGGGAAAGGPRFGSRFRFGGAVELCRQRHSLGVTEASGACEVKTILLSGCGLASDSGACAGDGEP